MFTPQNDSKEKENILRRVLKDQPRKRAPNQGCRRGLYGGNSSNGMCWGWAGLQTTAVPAENPWKSNRPHALASGGRSQEKSSDWLCPGPCSVTCRVTNCPDFPGTIIILALKILRSTKPPSPLIVGRRLCPLWLLFLKTAHNGGLKDISGQNLGIFRNQV